MSDFCLHPVRLSLLLPGWILVLETEAVSDESHGSGPDQRLQAVRVAGDSDQHAAAASARLMVLRQVVEQGREHRCGDERAAGVCGVGEAREQQQDGRLRRPRLRVVRVLVHGRLRDRRRGIQGDDAQTRRRGTQRRRASSLPRRRRDFNGRNERFGLRGRRDGQTAGFGPNGWRGDGLRLSW